MAKIKLNARGAAHLRGQGLLGDIQLGVQIMTLWRVRIFAGRRGSGRQPYVPGRFRVPA
jgi:hypothetical protein